MHATRITTRTYTTQTILLIDTLAPTELSRHTDTPTRSGPELSVRLNPWISWWIMDEINTNKLKWQLNIHLNKCMCAKPIRIELNGLAGERNGHGKVTLPMSESSYNNQITQKRAARHNRRTRPEKKCQTHGISIYLDLEEYQPEEWMHHFIQANHLCLALWTCVFAVYAYVLTWGWIICKKTNSCNASYVLSYFYLQFDSIITFFFVFKTRMVGVE